MGPPVDTSVDQPIFWNGTSAFRSRQTQGNLGTQSHGSVTTRVAGLPERDTLRHIRRVFSFS